MNYCERCHATYPTDFTTCPKDQSVLVAVSELRPGMVLRGKYEVLDKIGAGGMATVYRVRHLHLKEDVAIKVVSGRLAEDRSFLDRFRTEAVITRKLRHPNAVRLDDFDITDDGRPFIVMEFVRGASLRTVLQNGWVLAARACEIARQVALALAAAHELGIIHRDIKPENVLLVPQADGSELVKVLDFGIARLTGEAAELSAGHTPTRTGIILGTPQYVSPEQAKGARAGAMDGRSDLYSLGVVLYEMLTGELPFRADTPFDLLLQHIQTVPTPPHLAGTHAKVPEAVSELVMKALEKDSAKRFQSAAEMAEALVSCSKSAPAQADTGPHAFSTAALAAAAAVVAVESAAPAVAEPPNHTAVAAAPPLAKPATGMLTGEATIAMGSTSAPAVSKTAQQPAVRIPRRSWPPWKYAAAACLGGAILMGGYFGLRGPNAVPVDETVQAAAPEPVETRRGPVARPAKSQRRSQPKTAAPVADKGRAQVLVATGYRRLEQRDYNGARDAFEQALEIDPGNTSAQHGLKVAQGAQTVEGISGILRR